MDELSGLLAAFEKADVLRDHRLRTRCLLEDLVSVLQTLDRMAADPRQRGADAVRDDLQAALQRFGVEEIACLGQPFDPRCHEAAQRRISPGDVDGTVLQVLSRGFCWEGEPLARPRVVVAGVPLPDPGPQ